MRLSGADMKTPQTLLGLLSTLPALNEDFAPIEDAPPEPADL